jgi:DNA sulfur modification protein DndD
MKFTKLVIDNYKSFQLPVEIRFPVGSSGKSIFLIGGMNGSGKTSLTEAISICLYGAKSEAIFRYINRKEIAKGNASVSFELTFETDDHEEIVVKRSWSAGAMDKPKPQDLEEKLVVVKDGKRVSVQNKEIWQDFINATVPRSITQFFFFDGEKIQEIAADDHSEVRLKSSLEAALGIQSITRLSSDIIYLKQQERQNFVEISDEDLEFKQTELKREQSKLTKKKAEQKEKQAELEELKASNNEVKKRFQAAFHAEPETQEAIRQNEKRRLQVSNRLGQLENEIKTLAEKFLPFALAGKLFGGLKNQIESEREDTLQGAIREHAGELAKQLVRVVEEPEPIYQEKLSPEKMAELEQRIFKLLREGTQGAAKAKILNLSERDAARVLARMEEIESSEVFLLMNMLEEKRDLETELKRLEGMLRFGASTEVEKELFQQLQTEMEGYSTQIGRKTEQLRGLEEEILALERHISEIELEVNKLFEKHNVSKEKIAFLSECDAIANLLTQFTVRLRQSKVALLQDKTFEMYRLLSSKSGLIQDLVIDDKTYEITIRDRNGHEMRKSSLSAGEKEVFAVSLLWGLAQTSQLKLPIIIDTPLSRLDSTHRDNIINNYFPNAADQVVILSTDMEIDKNYFKLLEPHLSGAAHLLFDQRQELTTLKEGYFWEA